MKQLRDISALFVMKEYHSNFSAPESCYVRHHIYNMIFGISGRMLPMRNEVRNGRTRKAKVRI